MKPILTSLVALLLAASSVAQIPEKAFDLANSLTGLAAQANYDQAVKNSIELSELYFPFLEMPLFDNIGMSFVDKADTVYNRYYIQYNTFIRKLYKADCRKINEMIWPLIAWLDIRDARAQSTKTRLTRDFIRRLPADSLDWGKMDVYGMMIVKCLDTSRLSKVPARDVLFTRLCNHWELRFKKYPDDESIRYFLAFSWFYRSQADPMKKGEFLAKAAEVSPHVNPGGYFYNMFNLDKELQRKGFRKEYTAWLEEQGNLPEALNQMVKIALEQPVQENMTKLRTLFNQVSPREDSSFSQFWQKKVLAVCKPMPAKSFTTSEGKEVLAWEPTGKWTYIDVWGTWCSPCVAELPDFQEFYTKNLQNPDSPLRILTWAFDDETKLNNFMKEKSYSFPVLMVPQSFLKIHKINNYPTKLLISPEGSFLNIPFGVNWREYVANYLGL